MPFVLTRKAGVRRCGLVFSDLPTSPAHLTGKNEEERMKSEKGYPLASAFMTHQLLRTETVGLTVDGVPDIQYVCAIIESHLSRHRRLLITFVNPASVAVARTQPTYQTNLGSFDLVLPDGWAMSTAIRLVHWIRANRISFDATSLAPHVLTIAERRGASVALIGGLPGCTSQAALRLREVHPKIRIVRCYDGYGDTKQKAVELAELQPDIVICGMGAGAQEMLLLDLAKQGWNGCGFTCGGYFDQLLHSYEYYPKWIDASNLRWAYRLSKEPRRLWRRYLLDYPVFVGKFSRQLIHGWVRNRSAKTCISERKANASRIGDAQGLGAPHMKVDK
jgi:N-acetylglucosaminyldiphosphoundecaprenol N-acetyl-beta-D-mannosaminyltransferase